MVAQCVKNGLYDLQRPITDASQKTVRRSPQEGWPARRVILFVDTFCIISIPRSPRRHHRARTCGYKVEFANRRLATRSQTRPLAVAALFSPLACQTSAPRGERRARRLSVGESRRKHLSSGSSPLALPFAAKTNSIAWSWPGSRRAGKQLYLIEEFLPREHQNQRLATKPQTPRSAEGAVARPLPFKRHSA